MTEVNNKVFKVKVIGPGSFSIGDTKAFGAYTGEGFCE